MKCRNLKDTYSFETFINKIANTKKARSLPIGEERFIRVGVSKKGLEYDSYKDIIYTENTNHILHRNGYVDLSFSSPALITRNTQYTLDGLGVYTTPQTKQSGFASFSSYRWGYPTIHTIYNLYEEKTFQGFIGTVGSLYNCIPLCCKDRVLRYYDNHPTIFKKPYWCLDKKYIDGKYKYILYSPTSNDCLEIVNEWINVWWHVPMWLRQPNICLKDTLRIIALHLVKLRLEYKRHFFIGICHKANLNNNNQVILLSFHQQKLSRMKVPPEVIKLVQNSLSIYSGYTSNAYISWYYFPIIEPIEYGKVIVRSNKEYNTLAGHLI